MIPRAAGGTGPWLLIGLFALVLALHLAAPRLDSDQAITGLMGLHILRGEFPVVFWGQHHAGVPESYGAAVTFFVLGVSRFALSLVPALSALALVLAVYRTGALLFGRPAGLLAILFATVVSPYVFAHYVRARSYYVEHLLVGQIVLLGTALILTRPLSEAARSRALVAMGLAGGVGLYFGFQIVDALIPAALALLWVDPWLPLRRGAWLGLGAFLLGSAPLWLYNLTEHWATFATGVRFQGAESGLEAARTVFVNLLPVVLGVQDYVNTPPYLPGLLALVVPAVATAAVVLLALRVAWAGPARVRRDPALMGEALLLVALVVTIGSVWYGRFVAVPRYLVPLAPILALILARTCQLVWRRTPIVAVALAGAYLVGVGVGLIGDLTVLWPRSRVAYQAEREQDAALFRFLKARGLTRAYGYEYWLTARLTFDAGEEIIIAEPFNDKHPAYTAAVDASRRPAYIVRAGVGVFENWISALQTRGERAQVGPYTVFWDFAPPPPVRPIARAGWSVRTSTGAGAAASLVDGRLDTGWSSAPGPPASAWLELEFDRTQALSGLTLIADQPEHVPQGLMVELLEGAPARAARRFETGGFTAFWRNGALRAAPGRTLTLRFPPVEARRLRLTELAPGGTWAVAELFALAPASGPSANPDAAIEAARALEAAGAVGPALLRYREAMRDAPDDPEGYAEFARLAVEVGLNGGWLAEQAARHARLGLVEEARVLYARVAATLGPDLVYPVLIAEQARLAAAAGDAAEVRRLGAAAEAARSLPSGLAAAFGRSVALDGYTSSPGRARPGETLELVYRWRLASEPGKPLAAHVHFQHAAGERGRFADDYGLPEPLRGLARPQDVLIRRHLRVPDGTPAGTYRVVAEVSDPVSGRRLHRWWAGIVPALGRTVELGTVEILPPS